MKKLLLSIIFIMTIIFGYAQQVPVISQYMFNRLLFNPAYAGSNEQLSASIMHRSQWMGIHGNPSTQFFSLDAPMRNNIGIGLNIGNCHTGVTDQTDVLGSLSYNIGGSGFSFGMRGGFSYYQAHLTKAFVWQQDDPVFANDIKSAFLPKFGFGMYYFDGFFYAGLSVPDLIIYDATEIFTAPNSNTRNLKRNYILTVGHSLILMDNIYIEPSVLVKYHPTYSLLLDLNCNIKFSEKFLTGISYRANNAFIGLVQLKVADKIKVGYAFDIYQPNVKLNYFGTHEIMVSYNLGIE